MLFRSQLLKGLVGQGVHTQLNGGDCLHHGSLEAVANAHHLAGGHHLGDVYKRQVWQAVGAVNIPVVGLGGIATGRDALEFIMAGAAAVQVGAANFANTRAMETIADEMAAWIDVYKRQKDARADPCRTGRWR